ncbi:MAG: hypothetical protein K6E29_01445 [Cyanobacteria bacterium RUI128]|nr:hypothetical protein [Cyanobacteria bacterium RUI128]
MLCPYCKGEIPDDAKKCMNCGEWVDPAYRKPKKEEQGFFSALSETVLNVLWFAFVLAIAAIAIILFMQANANGLFD